MKTPIIITLTLILSSILIFGGCGRLLDTGNGDHDENGTTTPNTYTISGILKDSDGSPVPYAVMELFETTEVTSIIGITVASE
ncbi:hypothetical protein ACFL2K_00390 [Candidatus Margulisiibacteriota bacterium]